MTRRISLLLIAFAIPGCGSSDADHSRGSGGGADGSGTGGASDSKGGTTTGYGGGAAVGGAGTGSTGGGGATAFDPACGPVLQKPRCLAGSWCWDAPALLGGDLFDIDGTPDAASVFAVG